MTDPKELADALTSLDEDNCLETHERRTLESAIAFLRSLEDRGVIPEPDLSLGVISRQYDQGKRVYVQGEDHD